MEFFIKVRSNSIFRKFFWTVLVWAILITIFAILKRTVTPTNFIHIPLDDYIPLIPAFVVPYFSWFFYLLVGFVFVGLKGSKSNFIKLQLTVFIGMGICFISYIVFPNGLHFKTAASVSGQDIFSKAVAYLYSIDAPKNVMPSIHVLDTIAVHIAILKMDLLHFRKLITGVSWLFAVSICASTVFIKQHSILDVFVAIGLWAVLYVLIYYFPQKWEHNKNIEINRSCSSLNDNDGT